MDFNSSDALMDARSVFLSWGPVVIWATIIFWFSTESFAASETSRFLGPTLSWLFPDLSPDRFATIHISIRKLGHWSEYFIFALLVFRALPHGPVGSRGAYATAISLLYAISDELHQAFVPGRTASFNDVLLDLFGAVCAIFWLTLQKRLRNKLDKLSTNGDHRAKI